MEQNGFCEPFINYSHKVTFMLGSQKATCIQSHSPKVNINFGNFDFLHHLPLFVQCLKKPLSSSFSCFFLVVLYLSQFACNFYFQFLTAYFLFKFHRFVKVLSVQEKSLCTHCSCHVASIPTAFSLW